MGSAYADCDKLASTAEKLVSTVDNCGTTTINSVNDSIKSINDVGSKHDDCFSGLSADKVTDGVESTKKSISALTSDIGSIMNAVTSYACSSDKEAQTIFGKKVSDIKSKGLANAIIWDFKTTDNENFVSRLSQDEIQEGYDVDFYNKILKEIKKSAGSEREAVTATAIFMSTYFPHLPYFWGGGHREGEPYKGVNPSWGTPSVVTVEGFRTGENIPYSVDCSGFVDWVLYNNDSQLDKLEGNPYFLDRNLMNEVPGTTESLTADGVSERVKTGDFAHMDGHIGMVVSVDGTKVTVAHCSGSGDGMNLTTIDTVAGVAEDGTPYEAGSVIADSSNQSRLYKPYFTEVREVEYD